MDSLEKKSNSKKASFKKKLKYPLAVGVLALSLSSVWIYKYSGWFSALKNPLFDINTRNGRFTLTQTHFHSKYGVENALEIYSKDYSETIPGIIVNIPNGFPDKSSITLQNREHIRILSFQDKAWNYTIINRK